jgi:hypothetical protein
MTAAKDAVADTAKAGSEEVKEVVATATEAVAEIVPGRTKRRRSTPRRKARSTAGKSSKRKSSRWQALTPDPIGACQRNEKDDLNSTKGYSGEVGLCWQKHTCSEGKDLR